MIFIGIDPGKTGSMSVISDVEPQVFHTPLVGKEYDLVGMVTLLQPLVTEGAFVVIERAQAMPKQGTVSMFEFGRGYGIWLGILAALGATYQIVHPRTWTKYMLEGAPGDGKERAVHVAMRLFKWKPRLKKEWQYADSILLAEYARRIYYGDRK